MTAYLLDVNVLVALCWPAHSAHTTAQRWFASHGPRGWATCPLTQTGFVRMLSNPAFSSSLIPVSEGLRILNANLTHPAHRFWKDEVALPELVLSFQQRIRGHQQVSDAYLLGLAMYKKGKLATLDSGIAMLLSTKAEREEHLEILRE